LSNSHLTGASSRARFGLSPPFLYHRHFNLRSTRTPLDDGPAEWDLIAGMHSVKRGGHRSSNFSADTRSGSPSFSSILLQTRPPGSTAKRLYVLCGVIHLSHHKPMFSLNTCNTVYDLSILNQHVHRVRINITHVTHYRSLESRPSCDISIDSCVIGTMGVAPP